MHFVNLSTLCDSSGRYRLHSGAALHYLSAERDLVGRSAALSGSDREIGEIVDAWRSKHVESGEDEIRMLEVHGGEASERLFKQESPHYRVLHLATHAFFVPERCLAQRGAEVAISNSLLRAGS